MKKSILTMIIFCVASIHAQDTQFVFGVKQSSQYGSAYFGIKQNRVIVTLGSDFFHMGLDGSYETIHQSNASLKEKTTQYFLARQFVSNYEIMIILTSDLIKPVREKSSANYLLLQEIDNDAKIKI